VVDRNPKRARKKEARDRRAAAYAAAYRRRRVARVVAVIVVLAVIGGLVVYATGTEDTGEPAAGNNDATPSPTPAPGDAPCPEVEVPESNPKTDYAEPPNPDDVLEAGVDYSAVLHTSCGDIEIDLLEERRATVASFVFLAREGYFDGLTWHRVEQDFVIQSGDPNGLNGQPPDGPGYQLPDEVEGTRDRDYRFGTVAMANAGPNTGGSQFFVVVHDFEAARSGGAPEPTGLQPLYTIFGETDRGSYRVLDKIARQPVMGGTDPMTASQPAVPVYIESIEIEPN
jgi:cyclophilin family peptidyl-prolyl cis-trans isomerase